MIYKDYIRIILKSAIINLPRTGLSTSSRKIYHDASYISSTEFDIIRLSCENDLERLD